MIATRPFGYTQLFRVSLGFPQTTRERGHSWEFPLIAKYRFSEAGLHPFLGLGYEPRIVNATNVSTGPPPTVYSTTHGLVVSGGMDFGVRRLRISPELRYVHWTQPFLDQNQFGPGGSFNQSVQSAQNEVFVLFGLMWR